MIDQRGVIDQQVGCAVFEQNPLRPILDRLVPADVHRAEFMRLDKLSREPRDLGMPPSAPQHGVPGLHESLGHGSPQTARGPGDDDDFDSSCRHSYVAPLLIPLAALRMSQFWPRAV